MENLSNRAKRDIITQFLVFTNCNYNIYKVNGLYYLEINNNEKFIILNDNNFNDDEIKKLKTLKTNEQYIYIQNKMYKNINIFDCDLYKRVKNFLFGEDKIDNIKFYVVNKPSRSNMSAKLKIYTIVNNKLINLCANEKTNYIKVDGFGFNRIEWTISNLLGYKLGKSFDYTIINEF